MNKPRKPLYFLLIIFLIAWGCSPSKQTTQQTPAETTISSPTTFHNKEEYLQARRQLLQQDSLNAFDADIMLNAAEKTLNKKLLALRHKMLQHYDSIHFFPPARYFYKWKEEMYGTQLFKILKSMPKGGIHHLHPGAGIDFHWIVNRALQESACYVYWAENEETYLKGELHFFKENQVPSGFHQVQSLQDSLPQFSEELFKLLTFDASISNDSVDIWGEFEKRFDRIGGFITYQPLFVDFYTACLDGLAEDGLQHAELRSFLGGSLYDLDHEPGSFGYDSIIQYVNLAARRISEKRNQPFTIQHIYTNVRFLPEVMITKDLEHAYQVRAAYPDLVKAYDLVAQEDAGHTTEFFLNTWLLRDSLENKYGIDMPLCLHDGETDWEHLGNVYDAVLLDSKRIGHGFNLSFFPTVEQAVKERDICIEVSPLSNQILGYIGDLRVHPAHAWLNHGIQISINSDDPGIFDYVGVTPDYWAIFLAWELDLRALKKLSMNSLTYSFLGEEEKEKALQYWSTQWDAFVQEANIEL